MTARADYAALGIQGGDRRSLVADTLHADMDRFLAGVERRALAIAELAVRDRDEAMDIVQDAMIRLVRRYSERPAGEWTPLFYRILNNRIRDLHRRNKVRNRVMAWFGRDADGADYDPVAEAPDRDGAPPEAVMEAEETYAELAGVLESLPPRQREAFVLRSLEGLDVATTAKAMGVSDGSVKTHYSRAMQRLRAVLAR